MCGGKDGGGGEERERERERERQRERETKTQTEAERETDRQTDKHRAMAVSRFTHSIMKSKRSRGPWRELHYLKTNWL